MAALFGSLLLADVATAGDPVGKAASVRPSVTATGERGSKSLSAGDPVFFMDKLTASGGGVGEFVFNDGTKLALGPSSSVVVDRFVLKSQSSFQKFGVSAVQGSFRWVSGSSPHSAYRITTPLGTMGVRGTAFDVTVRRGVNYVVMLNGSGTFCRGSSCQTLSRTGDFISITRNGVSPKQDVRSAFRSRREAGQVFPFLANPSLLSARFRVAGSNVLSGMAANNPPQPSGVTPAVGKTVQSASNSTTGTPGASGTGTGTASSSSSAGTGAAGGTGTSNSGSSGTGSGTGSGSGGTGSGGGGAGAGNGNGSGEGGGGNDGGNGGGEGGDGKDGKGNPCGTNCGKNGNGTGNEGNGKGPGK